jgi:hypothetical protein
MQYLGICRYSFDAQFLDAGAASRPVLLILPLLDRLNRCNVDVQAMIQYAIPMAAGNLGVQTFYLLAMELDDASTLHIDQMVVMALGGDLVL